MRQSIKKSVKNIKNIVLEVHPDLRIIEATHCHRIKLEGGHIQLRISSSDTKKKLHDFSLKNSNNMIRNDKGSDSSPSLTDWS